RAQAARAGRRGQGDPGRYDGSGNQVPHDAPSWLRAPGSTIPRRPGCVWSLSGTTCAAPVRFSGISSEPHRPGEVMMAVIVVTRLRLKDPALQDDFFTDAVAALEQAQKSDGNLGVDALGDANNAWWTVTSWQERRLMHSYVRTDPHRTIQAHLDRYC